MDVEYKIIPPSTKLYAIQVKTDKGWEFGPKFYGMDTETEMVGPYFVASLHWALEEARALAKHRELGTTRIVSATLNEEPEVVLG